MADFTSLEVKNETDLDVATTSEIAAAAASQTVSMDGYKELILYVVNADAAADAYVTIKAGDGIHSSLGDMIKTVEHGETGVIKITDTMRFVTQSTGKVTVELNDASGDALVADVLSDITLLAIRK
jgi:hypothetical protein